METSWELTRTERFMLHVTYARVQVRKAWRAVARFFGGRS